MKEEITISKKLDRKDVKNAAWTWMFFHHCAQNFERMQGLAFCHTMSKPLEKLYGDDPEELKAALTRHMQFFIRNHSWAALFRASRSLWKKHGPMAAKSMRN